MILGHTASGGRSSSSSASTKPGVRRVGFRLVDGRLEWLRWSGRDAFGEPSVEPLLDVRGVRWRFLLDNVRTDAWPPADRRSQLPDAIILELDLADVGTLTRLIALR
jgi:type II secretion system protein J